MAAIGGSYPTTAASVAEWLSALNLSKHEAALTGAGITQVSQLMGLTDEQLIAADIRLVGQRKRLIAASKELTGQSMEVEAPAAAPGPPAAADGAMDVDATPGTAVAAGSRTPPPSSSGAAGGSEDPPLADPQGKRFNSTSSIYINSTIIKPDIDEIIFCVAVVIHDRIEQGEQMGVEIRQRFHYFSEENNPLYADPVPQQEKKAKREIPTEETIFHTIRSVYECARFPSECLIVSLVYIERLVATSEVPILCTSWRPILLAGLILAQKVWDDRSLHNVDFSFFCPMFTLKEINHLEKKFLELIDYDVSVSSSLYASYYFQLRTLCQRENREFHLKPMDVETAAKLEARGIAYAQKFAKAAGKTWQSANDIDAPKTSIAAMAIRHNSGEVPAAPGGGTTAPLRGGGTL